MYVSNVYVIIATAGCPFDECVRVVAGWSRCVIVLEEGVAWKVFSSVFKILSLSLILSRS